MAGPDVGGSMGGQDPEKYGPIRSLLAYYAKQPHIFTACVRDNRKRFGPRTNQVCAWVKDQIKGTTYWRGKEGDLRSIMQDEGLTEANIQIMIYDSMHDQEVEYPPTKDTASQMCDNCGIEYDPDGYDEPCPDCGDWCDCDCEGMSEALGMHVMKRQMQNTMMEAKVSAPNPVWPSDMSAAEQKKATADLKAADAQAIKPSASASKGKKGKKPKNSTHDSPREIARPENGTIVYDDGSIKDSRTGLSKFPVQVYQDGSVRYDDGSVAKPGSLAALLVMSPMSKEDRNRLFAAGPAGLPMKDFASVEKLIDSVVKQAYAGAGKGGSGELASDALGQSEAMGGKNIIGDTSASMIVGAANAGRLKPSNVASPGASAGSLNDPNNIPMKPRRGEDVQRGPEGGRGVWRSVDGRSIFIKIGQTPNDARAEAANKSQKKPKKQ